MFKRFPFYWVSFLVLLLSHMALLQLFQRPFDASADSDIPKNVPFTLVINNLYTPRGRGGEEGGGSRSGVGRGGQEPEGETHIQNPKNTHLLSQLPVELVRNPIPWSWLPLACPD